MSKHGSQLRKMSKKSSKLVRRQNWVKLSKVPISSRKVSIGTNHKICPDSFCSSQNLSDSIFGDKI